jgi:creatine kinase
MLARKILGAGAAAGAAIGAAKYAKCDDKMKIAQDLQQALGLVQQAIQDLGGAPDPNYPPYGLAPGVQELPAWIKAGCGNAEYYCPEKGAVFPGNDTPTLPPDLSKHSSFMADVLQKQPELYEKLRDRKTSMGVTLAKCIKTGVDNPGHPAIKTVGLVAGDEESYFVFKELFDPIIDARHGGYPADAIHPTNLDLNQVSKTRLDPTGKYVLTSRVRTGRSIKGTRLPPSCTFEERRELERIIVKGLMNLKGDLKGDYFPLAGSNSYALKPGGMSHAKEEELRSRGNLFQEPDSTLLLASGCGRHWPDARGIYHNDAQNCFVWTNEEDQMRIVSMQKGDNIQEVFGRFVTLCDGVQKVLKTEGYDFMHTAHHGYILTCPSNIGTGLRAGSMVQVPLLSSRADFKKKLAAKGLQARGTAGVDSASTGGTWDISNADRLGKSEVALVNAMIEGVALCVKCEQLLEQGKSIDALW